MMRLMGTYRLRLPRVLLGLACFSILIAESSATDEGWTTMHEVGRCAMRGQCGKKSFFGGELPCPANELAKAPTKETRKNLVEICGDSWIDGDICCDNDQVGDQLAVASIQVGLTRS